MYRWKDNFSKKNLKFGFHHLANIKYVKERKNSISAKFKLKKSYDVTVYLSDNVIESYECTCSVGKHCGHIAALLYYIECHNSKFKYVTFFDDDVGHIVDNLDVNGLRDFLFYELMADDNLKDKFLYLYEEKILFDKDYYYGKLDYILDCGKVGDYNYTGVYDLKVIGGLLYEFINSDIGSLIRLEEDSFASELLNKCAFLLQEHLTTDSEFWYDCAFMYSILANKILMRNEDNPNKVFEDLEDNDYNIRRLGL